MESRDIACAIAAVVIGAGLIGAATAAAQPPREATVIGQADPSLQRKVSFADLNLAYRAHQKVLHTRIERTADELCFDLNGYNNWDCSSDAVRSTDSQVAAAIERAKLRMAGVPVGPAIAISMAVSARP